MSCTSASSPVARPRRWRPARPTRACSALHFLALRLRPMRIAFDVSPLSHERTGVNNYIRGSLRRARRGRRPRRPRGGRVRADVARRRRARDPRGARRHRRRAAAAAAAGRARDAHGVVDARPARLPSAGSARSTSSTSATGCFRRSARGVRATTMHDLVPLAPSRSGRRARTRAMHERKYRNAARTCDVVFANSAFTADDFSSDVSASRGSACSSHIPGSARSSRADGRGIESRSAVPAHRRDARAAQEPRHARRRVRAARRARSSSLAVAGGAGWGDQPELDRRGIVRLGRVTDEELARLYRGAAAVVYPSRFEGFGMPVTEAMASGAPVVASSHPSLDEACRRRGRARRSRRSRRRSPPRSREALGRREELRALGLAACGRFLVAPDGRGLPARGTSDSRSARHHRARCRRAPAPRATCAGLLDHLDVEVVEVAVSRPRRALRTRRRRRRLVPAAARAGRCRRAALPDVPRPVPRPRAARRHGARPRGASPSRSGSTAGRARTRASPCRASSARRRA